MRFSEIVQSLYNISYCCVYTATTVSCSVPMWAAGYVGWWFVKYDNIFPPVSALTEQSWSFPLSWTAQREPSFIVRHGLWVTFLKAKGKFLHQNQCRLNIRVTLSNYVARIINWKGSQMYVCQDVCNKKVTYTLQLQRLRNCRSLGSLKLDLWVMVCPHSSPNATHKEPLPKIYAWKPLVTNL